MAITLNSTPITSNKLNSQNVVKETLNNNVVYALEVIQRPEVYIHSSYSGNYGPTKNTINIQGSTGLYLSILLPLPAYNGFGDASVVGERVNAVSDGPYISLTYNGVKTLSSLPGSLSSSEYYAYVKQFIITNNTPEDGATYSNTVHINAGKNNSDWDYNINIETFRPAGVPD